MHFKKVLCILGLATLLWGCDELPVTAPVGEPQAIIGQIISDEYDIEVAAWQAQLVRSTIADSAGYFILEALPVGLYEIRITTPSGKTETIKSVSVYPDRTTSLREIRFGSLSHPIYRVYPEDSTMRVLPIDPRIQIYSREELDSASLAAEVSFTPAIEGYWYKSGSTYRYRTTSPLALATMYTFEIGPGLTFSQGQTWDDSLKIIFWTDSLRVTNFSPSPYPSSSVREFSPGLGFDLYLGFNTYVNLDSLNAAVSFTPPLEGVWIEDDYTSRYLSLKFFYTGSTGLRAEQDYLINIDGSVPLAGAVSLGSSLSLPFRPAPVMVVASSPRQGTFNQMCSGCPVWLSFNSEMDSVSIVSSFALESSLGDTVAGLFDLSSERYLVFFPDSALPSGAAYVARLDTTAHSTSGDFLKEPYALYFRVR